MLRPGGPTGQTLAEWLRPSGRADERPQCRIHTGRATRRASAHVPSKEGTRVRLCAISRKEEQKVRAPPAGRPTPELAGTNPRTGQAAGIFITLAAPAYSSWTSAVTCPRSRMAVVRCFGAWYFAVGRNWYGFSHTYLSLSLFRASPSLSSSVYLFSLLPFATSE